MSTDLVRLTQAADYAARQHIAQRRKGERAEPYINHLTEVAALLAEATDGNDIVLLMGGLLHDTLEDTDATYEDLQERFGPDVASLVAEVTDDKSLPKEERKRLQIEKTAGKSRRAKLLKIADKTSNLRSLVASPPAGWSRQRLSDYVVWAHDVVRSCRGLNPRLEAAFDAAHQEASRQFG
ncbi:MAG: bifunctional (p)ppGpp synthetase/guanosine-3',5'-bis(diphosphate) 3'-pyrophosphohydrolase [Reyranella sp.]|jgi:(p)ppGpp synthase/HD superfamily hydrolase|nr:bifunctional (p)ppGpp synthetase/guanosine-3',5'-bis(diphosphate) 3'-pyrophosphohydrolase [Reyranella sp.]MBL6649959.1 bifunctional (p)ppGpp synthetase/guanosine-3',5'-bis(diphosphate) 3'-pyrophosphohydrolase [Reyranella sp.]